MDYAMKQMSIEVSCAINSALDVCEKVMQITATPEQVLEANIKGNACKIRRVAIYMLKVNYGWGATHIGREIGRNRSVVMRCLAQLDELMENDFELVAALEEATGKKPEVCGKPAAKAVSAADLHPSVVEAVNLAIGICRETLDINTNFAEVMGGSVNRGVSAARQSAMWLLTVRYGWTILEIGRGILRNPATVGAGLSRIEQRIAQDADFRAEMLRVAYKSDQDSDCRQSKGGSEADKASPGTSGPFKPKDVASEPPSAKWRTSDEGAAKIIRSGILEAARFYCIGTDEVIAMRGCRFACRFAAKRAFTTITNQGVSYWKIRELTGTSKEAVKTVVEEPDEPIIPLPFDDLEADEFLDAQDDRFEHAKRTAYLVITAKGMDRAKHIGAVHMSAKHNRMKPRGLTKLELQALEVIEYLGLPDLQYHGSGGSSGAAMMDEAPGSKNWPTREDTVNAGKLINSTSWTDDRDAKLGARKPRRNVANEMVMA